MDQVALLTALLLLSIIEQGPISGSDKKFVAEIPFEDRQTQILDEEQTRKLREASNDVMKAQKVTEAQKNGPAVRLIIEGFFTGQATPDNIRRGMERAAATKKWLQTFGGLHRITMDDRLGASGENKRVAKIWIEEPAKGPVVNDTGRPDEPRFVKDIEFRRNTSEVANHEHLVDAWHNIRGDVQQKGFARLVIEGDAARSEGNARAENRASVIRRWFEGRPSIPNLQLSTRTGQEDKPVVRLIIEREQRQTSR
jgi:hypothetical protein